MENESTHGASTIRKLRFGSYRLGFWHVCTAPQTTEQLLSNQHAGKPAADHHLISDCKPMAASTDQCPQVGGQFPCRNTIEITVPTSQS